MLSGASVEYGSGDDGTSDETTSLVSSFVRTASGSKTHRKYGSTNNHNGTMNDNLAGIRCSNYIQHRVMPSDTLQGIALRYMTTMEHIKRINKMWSNDSLFLRDYLTVPALPDDSSSKCGTATLFVENEMNPQEIKKIYGHNYESPTTSSSCMANSEQSSTAPAGPRIQHSRTFSLGNSSELPNQNSDNSIQDYLGNIDVQIEQAKSRAKKLQKNSEVLRDLPDLGTPSSRSRERASSRLRLSLSDLGAEFNAATNYNVDLSHVVLPSRGGRKSEFYQLEQSREEFFEL